MIKLFRYPIRQHEMLQAWDSADELLLEHMKSLELNAKKILIINDQFGALACGLQDLDCTIYTDSYVSFMGIRHNSLEKIKPINNLSQLQGIYDFALIKIPKNMSFFEDILCSITSHLSKNSQIICGSMVKHLAPASFDLLEKYIGKTTTSLAQKKARLIFANFDKEVVKSPYPIELKIDSFEQNFINHSNLFSRDKLDIGTRFFLEHIPVGNFHSILDLGCGNGIVGIKAKLLNPNARILFSDDSAMAIESAKLNYQQYFKDEAVFFWTNCFEKQPKQSLDLVLCNPPFHQGNTVGDFIAKQMFTDAYDALKVGGQLRVIGNSHLAYQVKLKSIFGNSKILSTNKKFNICDAIKSL